VDPHRIVAKTEWIEARRRLLAKEKELTRLRDRLAQEQRALPWVKIEKTQRDARTQKPKKLAPLTAARRQRAGVASRFHLRLNCAQVIFNQLVEK
jgi:predicted dithiol-disulfide oxidoreductase (DUF899 family)